MRLLTLELAGTYPEATLKYLYLRYDAPLAKFDFFPRGIINWRCALERFTIAIRKSIQNENWFGAIFIALAMPDICGALETPNEKNGVRYKKWFNEYLKGKYHFETEYDYKMATNPHHITELKDIPQYEEMVASYKSRPYPSELNFTADDCYKFRCSCLHQGMSDLKNKKAALTPPLKDGSRIHKIFAEGKLQLQVDVLCEDICIAVEEWQLKHKENAEVLARIEELIEVKMGHFKNIILSGG